MSRKSRMQNAREAKDKRMKRIAAGGAVVLAAVLAFELPHYLSGNKSSTPPPATTTTPSTAVTGSGATAPGSAIAAVLPTNGSSKLPNSDVAPRRSKSQLVSFNEFAGKNPFVQQVTTPSAAPASSGSTPVTTTPSSGAITASAVSGSTRQSAARTLARVGSVTISVNGKLQFVRVGGSFPSANPLFRLVSVTNGLVRIGIANGSYASGAETVTLRAGRTLTLVDTADGIRYRLRLVSAS
jgi:hypothetical protein